MKKLLLLAALTFLVGCKESKSEEIESQVCFTESQPINDSELRRIPRSFQGIYMDSDSIQLEIRDKIILKKFSFHFKIHKSELDSLKIHFIVKGNTYTLKKTKEPYYLRTLSDSIEFTSSNVDTIFNFSDKQVAKRISGHIVLNEKDDKYWQITSLNLKRNTLKLNYFFNEELPRYDSITKIKSVKIDSLTYVVKPSRRELKKMLELKNPVFEQEFKKISR